MNRQMRRHSTAAWRDGGQQRPEIGRIAPHGPCSLSSLSAAPLHAQPFTLPPKSWNHGTTAGAAPLPLPAFHGGRSSRLIPIHPRPRLPPAPAPAPARAPARSHPSRPTRPVPSNQRIRAFANESPRQPPLPELVAATRCPLRGTRNLARSYGCRVVPRRWQLLPATVGVPPGLADTAGRQPWPRRGERGVCVCACFHRSGT